MTDDEDNEKRQSRRARRRAQAEAIAGEGTEAAEASDDESSESSPAGEDEPATQNEDSNDGSEDAGEAEGEDAGEAEGEDASAEADEETSSKPERTERPRPKKKKKKRTSVERAARDRNRRVRDRAEARRDARRRRAAPVRGFDASEMVDDAFSRHAQVVTNWLKDHFNIVQWFLLAGLVFGVGYWIYSWHTRSLSRKASDELAVALADANGRVLSESAPETADEEKFDIRPKFPNAKERLEATATAYRKAMKVSKGSGASILAELGLAGTLYDEGRFADAAAAYRKVDRSALAGHDADVKGRALEGIGMSLEAKGDPAGAKKAYRELASTDTPGFDALGLFHQAELAYNQGKKTTAAGLLRKVQKKLNDPNSPYLQTGYLAQMTHSLMTAIQPGGGSEFSPSQLGQLRKQLETNPTKLQQLLRRMGKTPENAPVLPGEMPSAPAPAPTGSAP